MFARYLPLAAAILIARHASAAERPIPGAYLGAAAGLAAVRIQQPGFGQHWHPGVSYEFSFGWQPSERWAVGGQFTSVVTSIALESVQLHTLAARLDYSPSFVGPVASGMLGLALTSTDAADRAGFGGAIQAGYRWQPKTSLTIAGYAGLHLHRYRDGWAVMPLTLLELRIHGN